MTSIINYEEVLKKLKNETKEKDNNQVFELSEAILEGSNRIYDAKLSGALQSDELSKELIAEGKLFSNQVEKGIKTEEDVENFEKELPDGKNNYFAFSHKGLDVAKSTIKQTNSFALLKAENMNKATQMPEGYSKGLKIAG